MKKETTDGELVIQSPRDQPAYLKGDGVGASRRDISDKAKAASFVLKQGKRTVSGL